jgi:hypothetical protein
MPAKSTQLIVVTAAAVSLALWSYGQYSRSKKKKAVLRKTLSTSSADSPTFYHQPSPPCSKDDDMADFLEGDTVVLDDAGVLAPSVEEVVRVANGIGVSRSVALKLLSDPLPKGWKACKLVEVGWISVDLMADWDGSSPSLHNLSHLPYLPFPPSPTPNSCPTARTR